LIAYDRPREETNTTSAAKIAGLFLSALYLGYKHLLSESYLFINVHYTFLYLRNITEGILTAYPHITRYRKSYSRIPDYSGYWVEWKKILRFTGKSPPIEEVQARRHDGIREFIFLETL